MINMKICQFFIFILFSLEVLCSDGIFVYHASPIQGLKELIPKASTHGKSWVYATTNLAVAAAYLGKWSDFDLAQGSCSKEDKIHLVERYQGAFKEIFGLGKIKSGSIYKLNSSGFLKNQTSFEMEVVNPSKVKVVEEMMISLPLDFLKELEKKGELDLYYYPNRPMCVPKDDSDLVEKTLRWIKEGKVKTKETLLKKHPHLAERIK